MLVFTASKSCAAVAENSMVVFMRVSPEHTGDKRQANVGCDAMLGNIGALHSCGCYFNT